MLVLLLMELVAAVYLHMYLHMRHLHHLICQVSLRFYIFLNVYCYALSTEEAHIHDTMRCVPIVLI